MTPTLTPTMLSRRSRERVCLSEASVLLESSGWSITMECSIAADTKRIFHALTVPEHMETWLSLPCCGSRCGNHASRMPEGFMMVHACDKDRSSTTITGFYSTCRTRKLAFSWTLGGDAEPARTDVDIRLYGDFDRSTLRLQHSGFQSEEACQWHRNLWSASLLQLHDLFDPPPGIMARGFGSHGLH